MVLGTVLLYGVSQLMFMQGPQGSHLYCQVVENVLVTSDLEVSGEERTWVSQQGNSPVHTTAFTQSWLRRRNIRNIPYPARSYDCIIIEHLWSILARKVYNRGRKFHLIHNVLDALQEAWGSI